jgi:SAM-dependent methyltransferase
MGSPDANADTGGSLRETEIRPDELMAEQARHYEADVARLLERRDQFVNVSCPACGGDASHPMWRKYELEFVSCDACETVYMDPRPSPDLLEEYYRTSQNYEYWSRVVFPASEQARRAKIFRPRAERVAEIARRHRSTMGTAIDVGAGFGTFCEELRALGSFERIIAVEPEPHLAAICRERDLEVIEAPIERVDLGPASADLVTAFEVIEHLFSPGDLIARCRDVLAPGGLLIVTCPNAKGFDVVQLAELASAVDTEHLNYFNPASLAGLLAEQGFEVLERQTPGRLDAELVRKRALTGGYDLDQQPFLKQVLIDDWETLGAPFQDFLVETGLSSNMWVVARRPS